MKKIMACAAALISVALFFGCSDSSSDNNAALLLAASSSSSSSSSSLPASVGTNELEGKSFEYSSGSTTTVYKFNSNTFTITITQDVSASANMYSAYKSVLEFNYSYSYDSTTKRIYSILNSQNLIGKRDNSNINLPWMSFYSESSLKAYCKNLGNFLYDKASTSVKEGLIDNMVKSYRLSNLTSYGYTDNTGAEAASDVVWARYSKYRALYNNFVTKQAYNLSGSSFKIVSDSYYPKSVELSDFTNKYSSDTLSVLSGDTAKYNINFAGQYYWPERNAAIMDTTSLTGFKVSSVTDNAIAVSETGIRLAATSDFNYTETTGTIVATKTVNDTCSTYELSMPVGGGIVNSMGTITINYATASNIPSFASATSYTLVTE
ncbi:MAG: hypothetical protein K6F15_01145 [Treponema sp.]|nr:hypothetical protein [Treponema sp.]